MSVKLFCLLLKFTNCVFKKNTVSRISIDLNQNLKLLFKKINYSFSSLQEVFSLIEYNKLIIRDYAGLAKHSDFTKILFSLGDFLLLSYKMQFYK